MGEGLYFLNCHDSHGTERSGIAFYQDLNVDTANVNQQPQAFVYTDVSGDTQWETDNKQRATFSSNVTVTWQINRDAPSKNQNDAVGSASNGFHDFTVRKDGGRFVFKNNDGFECFVIYYAN